MTIRKPAPKPIDISVDIDGRTAKGSYTVARGTVTVSTGFARKATQIGGSTTEQVARMLLRELAREGKASTPSQMLVQRAAAPQFGRSGFGY